MLPEASEISPEAQENTARDAKVIGFLNGLGGFALQKKTSILDATGCSWALLGSFGASGHILFEKGAKVLMPINFFH